MSGSSENGNRHVLEGVASQPPRQYNGATVGNNLNTFDGLMVDMRAPGHFRRSNTAQDVGHTHNRINAGEIPDQAIRDYSGVQCAEERMGGPWDESAQGGEYEEGQDGIFDRDPTQTAYRNSSRNEVQFGPDNGAAYHRRSRNHVAFREQVDVLPIASRTDLLEELQRAVRSSDVHNCDSGAHFILSMSTLEIVWYTAPPARVRTTADPQPNKDDIRRAFLGSPEETGWEYKSAMYPEVQRLSIWVQRSGYWASLNITAPMNGSVIVHDVVSALRSMGIPKYGSGEEYNEVEVVFRRMFGETCS
ncbi:hypothetical protein H0H87_008373 [Tephrocybe sp. NHM501043]|nr:hypothetical protein H0H87_008373 [Tephrocybe sp. NHM501043]